MQISQEMENGSENQQGTAWFRPETKMLVPIPPTTDLHLALTPIFLFKLNNDAFLFKQTYGFQQRNSTRKYYFKTKYTSRLSDIEIKNHKHVHDLCTENKKKSGLHNKSLNVCTISLQFCQIHSSHIIDYYNVIPHIYFNIGYYKFLRKLRYNSIILIFQFYIKLKNGEIIFCNK